MRYSTGLVARHKTGTWRKCFMEEKTCNESNLLPDRLGNPDIAKSLPEGKRFRSRPLTFPALIFINRSEEFASRDKFKLARRAGYESWQVGIFFQDKLVS